MAPLTSLRSPILLVARVLLGVIIAAHGVQKFFDWGIAGTAESFAGMGVPLPQVSAVVAATIELVGGVLIALGAFTPVAGIAVAFVMAGAAIFAHIGNGLFATDGGWELVAAIGVAALTLAVVGPGRFSVDHALTSRRGGTTGETRRAEDSAATTATPTAARGRA